MRMGVYGEDRRFIAAHLTHICKQDSAFVPRPAVTKASAAYVALLLCTNLVITTRGRGSCGREGISRTIVLTVYFVAIALALNVNIFLGV